MRIGVYCGSFNPPHKGHIEIADTCLKQNYVDKVLIIATGNYWHKQNLMPVQNRIEMLRNFESENIIIDDKHNDIPYTYLIFRELREEYPDDELFLIIGGDNLPDFMAWSEYQELLQYVFLVIPRDEIQTPEIENIMNRMGKDNYEILDIPNIPICSTFIRNNMDDYSKIEDCLDKRVYDYLLEHDELDFD